MSRSSFSTEGIVLARKNYGEADRLLTIFSRHYGKIFLLAKGVRKPKSRKRGHIEIFSRVRFSFAKNDNFVLMNEAELIDSYQQIRTNLKKATLSYYFVEVITKIIPGEEKHEELYNKLIEYLQHLKSSSKLKLLRLNFVEEVLVLLEYLKK